MIERLAESLIVPVGPGDAAALAEVHVRSWRETYEGLLPAPYLDRMSAPSHAARWRRRLGKAPLGEVVLAAEGPDGLVAYCAGARAVDAARPNEAEIFTLYLLKEVQGQGLGRRLFTATARALEAEGARSLRLWVLNSNVRAASFYTHMGGEKAGQRPVNGWGGGLRETAYRWVDIAALTA